MEQVPLNAHLGMLVEARCTECGGTLDIDATANGGSLTIEVQPCWCATRHDHSSKALWEWRTAPEPKPEPEPDEESASQPEPEDDDGCDHCAHVYTPSYAEPCRSCVRCALDHFQPAQAAPEPDALEQIRDLVEQIRRVDRGPVDPRKHTIAVDYDGWLSIFHSAKKMAEL